MRGSIVSVPMIAGGVMIRVAYVLVVVLVAGLCVVMLAALAVLLGQSL